jgi:lipopolysaccharide export LptBFGC system permease protein LptF
LSWPFLIRFIGSVFSRLLLVLAIVVGIFVTEKAGGLLETVAVNQVGLANFPILLTWEAPRVLSLAAPIALLIAVYDTLLRLREQNELVALASFGVDIAVIFRLVIVMAAILQLLNLWIVGSFLPDATHAQRSLVTAYKSEFVRHGLSPRTFHTLDNYVVVARNKLADGSLADVFIHEHGGVDHIVTAKKASFTQQDDNEFVTLLLEDFTYQSLPGGSGDAFQGRSPQSQRLEGNEYRRTIRMNRLVKMAPRENYLEETTIWELLKSSSESSKIDRMKEVTRRIIRSMLCLLVPASAFAGLMITNRRTQSIALPTACGLMLSAELVTAAIMDWTRPSDIRDVAVLSGAYLMGIAVITVLCYWVTRHQGVLKAQLAN